MKRLLLPRLLGLLWISILIWSPRPLATGGVAEATLDADGLQVLSEDQRGVLLSLNTSDYDFVTQITETGTFRQLMVPGYEFTRESGMPQLPARSVLLGVPARGDVEVRVVSDDSVEIGIPGVLLPSPYPALLDDELQPGQWVYPEVNVFRAMTSIYPEKPAALVGDAWLRDQRIVRLVLYPFQYLPERNSLIWHRRLQVEVLFPSNEAGFSSLAQGGRPYNPQAFERLLEQMLLNYETAKAWRELPTFSEVHTTHVEGPRLRIAVEADGLYRITYDDLVTAGMNPALFDPRDLHMTSQGEDIAITVVGEEDGSFDPGDYVLFYGQYFRGGRMANWYADESVHWLTYTQQLPDGTARLWHPEFNAIMMEKYTRQNVYWLAINQEEEPPRMATLDGTPGSAPVPANYRTTERAEIERQHWEYHYTGEDTWFGRFVVSTQPVDFTINLSSPSPVSSPAVVRGEVVAFSYNDYASPDHHTKFWLNSLPNPIDDAYWEGRSRYHFEAQVLNTDLVSGTNTLRFQALNDTSAPPYIMFDWFEVEYDRLFRAQADAILFTGAVSGTWRYEVDNFADRGIQVYDVTVPEMPVQVLNAEIRSSAGGKYRAAFQATHAAGAQYLLVSEAAWKSPAEIRFYVPPDLKSPGHQADYLLIAHPDFLAGAQALANYRAAQGLTTLVVDINDIYNEFNEGIVHPIAIKNFLEYAFAVWMPPAPAYVVLIGDGHWNPKMNYPPGYGTAPVFIPPNLSWVDFWQGEVDSANLLATIAGSDPLPDLMISRIPVNTADELNAVVSKIIAFEASPRADWQRNHVFVADNTPDPAGDFVASAESIIQDYVRPGYMATRVYQDDFSDYGRCGTSPYPGGPACPNVNLAIAETLNVTGTQILSYIGHAATRNWAHEQIWLYHPDDPNNPNDQYYNDFDRLSNQDRLPVVLSMTCLDGYWFHPTLQPSLAELYLRTPLVGAAGTFSPTGLGVATGHDVLQRGFYAAIYDGGVWSFGFATLAAKLALYQAGYSYDLLHTFTLFGDPALALHSPYGFEMSPEEASQAAIVGQTVTYTLVLTNTGVISDTFEMQLGDHSWQTTLPFTRTLLQPGERIEFVVGVEIPSDVPGGARDTVVVAAISRGDVDQQDEVVLRTTANVYGVVVVPAYEARVGLPGSSVLYALTISNTSNVTDTFSISLSETAWPTLPGEWEIGPLGPDMSASLPVTVSIPAGADDWAVDMAILTVTSHSDPSRQAISTLQTMARLYGVSVSPSFQYGSGRRGEAVTYGVSFENSGGYQDSLAVDAISTLGWQIEPEDFILGPLTPGETVNVNFTVFVPGDATAGEQDTITIQATSFGDPEVSDQGLLYATANVYGLALNANRERAMDLPNRLVSYTLALTNLANTSDIFDVSIGPHQWETSVTPMSVQVAAGSTVELTVRVIIPAEALPFATDAVTITLTSRADPAQSAAVTLATSAKVAVYLPALSK